MSNRVRTRAMIIVVLAIGALSIASIYQFGGRTSSTPGPSPSPTSVTSLSRSDSSTSSSAASLAPGVISFGEDYTGLIVTPSATMNYTFWIGSSNKGVTNVALSAASTLAGVSVTLNPRVLPSLETREAFDLQVSVAPTVDSSNVPINIIATTNIGVTNQTFLFSLDKELVVLHQGVTEFVKPTTLHASVGQRVTWYDTLEVDDDGNGVVTVVFNDGSAASPKLNMRDTWSHAFDKAGTYTYHVAVVGFGSSSGSIVVD